jgi:ABC-type Fe3+-citrate transport system substrate-binding protein
MNWASWGPTIVSIVTAIFIAGMMYGKQKDHTERLAAHDAKFDEVTDEFDKVKTRIGLGEVELAKLQSWRDGYNAATSRRDGYDAASTRKHGD